LMHREFVDVFFSRRYRLLADPRHAVLFDGNFQPVPVNRSCFRQFVFKDNAHAVALLHLNGRPREAPVVAPCLDDLERRDFSLHGLRHQFEDFYVAIHFVRQVRQVRSDHGQERIGPCWHYFLLLVAAIRTMVASLLGFSRRLRGIRRRASAHRLRQSKKTSAKKSRVLKKPSSRAAHSCLPELLFTMFVMWISVTRRLRNGLTTALRKREKSRL